MVARGEAIGVLNQVIAIPATTTIRDIPTEVRLDPSDGLPTDCVLAADNIALIRPALCTERITRLGPDKMRLVGEALALATAC